METEALRKQLSEEIAAQFDAKLREAKRQKSQIEEEFEQSSEKWRTERRRLNAEIDRLESALAEARQSGRETSETRPEVGIDPQEIIRLQAAADEKLREAAQAWEKERARLQAEISRLQEGIAGLIERSNNPLRSIPSDRIKPDARYDEAIRAKRQAEEALVAAKTAWEAEKLNLVNEATKVRQSTPSAGLPRKVDDQLDKRLQEALRVQTGLATDLEKARLELSRLKEAHATELQNMTARLQAAKAEWEAEKLNLVNEAAKLRQAPSQASAPKKVDDQLDKRLQEATKVRDGLASDLEKAHHEMTKLKETHSAELQDFTSRYLKTRTDLEKQLRESEETRAKLEHELETARQTSAPADGALSEEVSRLRKELDESLEEKKRMVIRLAESSDQAGADAVNELRQQFEVRMKEVILENSQLSEKVKNATSQLASEGARAKAPDGSGSSGAPVSTLDATAIDEEVKRVEDLTAEIAKLIDDPETELATVIRKNVERAALEAYLKGILFSLGRGKKL